MSEPDEHRKHLQNLIHKSEESGSYEMLPQGAGTKALEKRLRFISTLAGRGFGLSLDDGKQIVAAADALKALQRENARLKAPLTAREMREIRDEFKPFQTVFNAVIARRAENLKF